jgi:hypothetical protein
MMIPNVSRPVSRRELYEPFFPEVIIGTDPDTGKPFIILDDLDPRAIPFPNDPQRWKGPVPCEQGCYLFSGFSRNACLVGCRR